MQCRNWNPIFTAEKLLLTAKPQSSCTLPAESWISGSEQVPWLKTSPSCWKCPHKAVIAECCFAGGEHREHKPGNPGQPVAFGFFFLSTHKPLIFSPISITEVSQSSQYLTSLVWNSWNLQALWHSKTRSSLVLKKKSQSQWISIFHFKLKFQTFKMLGRLVIINLWLFKYLCYLLTLSGSCLKLKVIHTKVSCVGFSL